MTTLKEYLEARLKRNWENLPAASGIMRADARAKIEELQNTLAVMSTVKFDDYKPLVTNAFKCHWCKGEKSEGQLVYVGGSGEVWRCDACYESETMKSLTRKEGVS
ncbi:MAG: hypothetical protein U1D67_10595 [Dehalococcoidia bacterium]|nr:hypothetical protein [Dehalococcoidia bacterium]